MALIVAPIAALSVTLAARTYRVLTEGIEASHIQIASHYAARTNAWIRGSSNALLSASAGMAPLAVADATCDLGLRNVIAANDGYVAMRVRFANGRLCQASVGDKFKTGTLNALAQEQAARAHMQLWAGSIGARGRFDAIRIDNSLYLLIDVLDVDAQRREWTALLLVDPALLERALQFDATDEGIAFAVMKRGGELIVARGAPASDKSWLPAKERLSRDLLLWRAASIAGPAASYGVETISEPDIYVLTRFDDRAARAAWEQFIILWATPILMMLVLLLAYAHIIQKDVLRWITAIEASARSQLLHPGKASPAPVDPEMPSELRSVSESFNAMVSDADEREDALRKLLRINQELMRELHHRVKNSLQVIQSYLALSRREQTEKDSRCLAETEARVQVLASAYRLALTEGGMRLVPLKPFVEEIVENVASFAREAHQWISLSLDWEGAMVIDRVIPFGLALVEILIAGLEAPGATNVKIVLRRLPNEQLELCVTADAGVAENLPSEKVMTGLAAQLGAQRERGEGGRVFIWRFAS
jgi:two-component sensor histidine kinase